MAAAQDNTDQNPGAKNETPVKSEKREEKTVTIRLSDFVQKYRKEFFVVLIAMVVILIGFVAGITIRDKMRASAYSKVDGFSGRYEALRIFMGSEDPEAADKQTDIETLLADIDAFTRRTSGFAAARAYTISASVYEAQKKWAEAETLWTEAAKAAGKTYLAPVSVFNAAVAAEEQGNTEAAINLYNQALGYSGSFPGAARAQFSIGRLEESRNNREAALEAYRNLVGNWPGDTVWANLAQSRIVVLAD